MYGIRNLASLPQNDYARLTLFLLLRSFGVQEILSSFIYPLQCIEASIYLLLSCYTEQFHSDRDGQLFVIPFAKSATTGQHSPVSNSSGLPDDIFKDVQDNTRYAFLQMDDRVLIYRGADQPDLSVINPESDVWQHIKV